MFGINDNIEMILDGVSRNDVTTTIFVYICFDASDSFWGTYSKFPEVS